MLIQLADAMPSSRRLFVSVVCLLVALSPTFAGPTTRNADPSTLDGKIMCGYQGWFNTPADGAGRGFAHWARQADRPLADGNVNVDLWPDLREFDAAELYPTELKFADGREAAVFSSANRTTVMRHFRWMRDYGIDGVFIQRFASEIRNPRNLHNVNALLEHCRAAANANGRTFAVMYDLSGLRANETQMVIDDWHALQADAHVTADAAYQHHRGKPLVAIWGIGFNDSRPYSLDDCAKLIDAIRQSGCTVMVGVPTYWRTLERDTVHDAKLHEVISRADIISPWTVGRYGSPDEAARYAERTMHADIDWCAAHQLDYLPVVFPGFSWHNMHDGRTKTDQIPRLGGRFLWSQLVNARQAGARFVYVAMFDELDEGTAIMKLAQEVPAGDVSKFVPLNGVPGDRYLQLVGEGGRLIRGERDASFPAPSATEGAHP
jgi:hypothetical protein